MSPIRKVHPLVFVGRLDMHGFDDDHGAPRLAVGGRDVIGEIIDQFGTSRDALITFAMSGEEHRGRLLADTGEEGYSEVTPGSPADLAAGGAQILDWLDRWDGQDVELWVGGEAIDLSAPPEWAVLTEKIRLAHRWRDHSPGDRISVSPAEADSLRRGGYVLGFAPGRDEAPPAPQLRKPAWHRRPPEDGERYAHTWDLVVPGSPDRWQLERRSGRGEDFGWYLFGQGGSPFGLWLHRRLPVAKQCAEDYALDVPGARECLLGGQHDGSYVHPSDRIPA